eukprot:CAMPEP_0202979472 /NCGR_PEP_ID=MMETSP1396-20130829/85606_1 /ASSEMBLY_ACC=CAM_ASM_000872 /TAXON_ID= /ORGANISM="Pseudokeronopsis sp., Strain Brazil" /LENGTH=48 /DNA_ID= /DNA_START= /DNA_END= /DNA_ORIENTATION=
MDQHYLDLVRMDNVTLDMSKGMRLREKDEVVVGVKGEDMRLFRKSKDR